MLTFIDTEIDWVAYMQQVQQVVDGERDYTVIKGDTGPLVYPAMHVYIYRGLYEITQQGTNILLAQVYFSILYIFNLGLAMLCYMNAKVRSVMTNHLLWIDIDTSSGAAIHTTNAGFV